MIEQLLFYIFVLISICITGYWIERVVRIVIEAKTAKTKEFFIELATFFQTVYDYLTEDIENE